MQSPYDSRRINARANTKLAVDSYAADCNATGVMNTTQLLARLKDVGARNVDMARVLGIPDSRIAEIRAGKRQVKLDEAAKLVEFYKLEEAGTITPLTTPIARLLVLHVANSVQADLPDEAIADLAADLRAFATFVSDPQVRDSVQAADGFLQALRIRRKAPRAAPQEQRPRPAH